MTASLPQNTCPLCRQPALDQRTTQWRCEFCGCELEFDPTTRRARLTYVPPAYAAVGDAIGSDWLTRREMFQRADAAPPLEMHPASNPALAPFLALVAVLLTVLVILSAVAAALLLSPSISRTRRVISAAYQSTPTAPVVAAVAEQATPSPTPETTLQETSQPPDLSPPALESDESATPEDSAQPGQSVPTPPSAVDTPDLQAGVATLTSPPPPVQELPTPTSPATADQPPPVFSPIVPATPPATETPLPPTFTSVPLELTPTPSPTPLSGNVIPTLTPTPTPTPLQFGAVIFQGTIQVSSVRTQGDLARNEADEYIELRNIGSRPVLMGSWVLRVYQPVTETRPSQELVFNSEFVMVGGQLCRVYTNLPFGPENCGLRGFGVDTGILPPNGARASLFDNQGNEMARLVW